MISSEVGRNLKEEQSFMDKVKSTFHIENIKTFVTDEKNILMMCIIAFSVIMLCGFGIFICCCKTKVSEDDSDLESIEEAPREQMRPARQQ